MCGVKIYQQQIKIFFLFLTFTIFIDIYCKEVYLQMKKEVLLNFRIEEILKTNFDKYCKDNGFSLSKRVRLLIEKDLEGKITIEK